MITIDEGNGWQQLDEALMPDPSKDAGLEAANFNAPELWKKQLEMTT